MGAVFKLLIFVSLSSVSIAQDPQPKPGNHVMCYYTSWSVYGSSPYNFKPEDIDPFLCTHIIYAFATFGGNFDIDRSRDEYTLYQPRLVSLKARNPDLKILISLGGWNEGTQGFATITENKENREKFSKYVVKFLREDSFDGIDLNWQHPTVREGGKPEDKENYVYFAQTLRQEFENEAAESGKPRLLLAISITQSMKALPGYDIHSFSTYMDFISVLCYDYSFSLTATALHHAPLYSLVGTPQENKTGYIDNTINYFLERAEAHKLVLGIPAFGRSWTLANPEEDHGLGAEADGGGTAGAYTDEKGVLAYFEICSKIAKENWTVVHPEPRGKVGPYAYKGDQWVSYDDADMVRTKARYAMQKGLAGVVFWTIDNDDFLGSCDQRAGKYPLINAAKRELNRYDQEQTTMGVPDELEENEIITKKPSVTLPPPPPILQLMSPTMKPLYKPVPTQTPNPTPSSVMDSRTMDQPRPWQEMDPEDLLVQELVGLIERAGGVRSFCRLLRQAKTAYKLTQGSRRAVDIAVDVPYMEPLRLLITNSSVTIQELNIYGAPSV